jgi:ankyrin repeat protein
LILKLIKNDDIEDFSISSNNKKFGDFDDVVLEIKYYNQNSQTYALQLKHINKRRVLTVAGLTGKNGNFSITKYIKGFKFVDDSVRVILFTNSLFNGSEGQRIKFEPNFIIILHKSPQDSLLATSEKGHSYKFTIENPINLPEPTMKFFDNFLVYTNQMNVEELEERTQSEFQNMFSSEESVFKDYIYFVNNWSLAEGKKMKLGKSWVKRAIALQLLTPFIKPLSFAPGPVNENTKLLREAISRFRIAIFDRKHRREVTILWKDFKDEINDFTLVNKIRKQYQIRVGHIHRLDDLSKKELSKMLWLMGKCPLVVDGRSNISAGLNLCLDDKFVILSPNFPIDSSSSFQNLSDLQEDPEMFQNVLNNFTYSLPCTETVTLTDLDVDMKDITTDELLEMSRSYNLEDKEDETLPPHYIKRNLGRIMIDPTFLNQICRNNLILISSVTNVDSLKRRFIYVTFVKLEEFSNDDCDDIVAYVTDGEYSQKQFDELCLKRPPHTHCHHFGYVNDNCLEWIRSKNSIEKLRKYRLVGDSYDKYVISETELFDSPSTNHVNIICANPGMGKSALMKNLKKDAPATVLRVLIYARNHASYFRKKDPDAGAFVDYILNDTHKKDGNFNKRILKMLKTRGRLEFIWDGLDEISEGSLVVVKEIIKNVSKKGHRQWITSRNNLKTELESEFNVFSKTLTQFDDSEQRRYVGNRLDLYGDDLTKIFQKIKKTILHNNNILGIPLQIFMLTELFVQDEEKYCDLVNETFSAADLYQHFVDQKFKLYFKEKENQDDKFDIIYAKIKTSKISVINNYKKVAAATYLGKDHSEDVGYQDFLKKIQSDKDPYGFITYVSDPEFCHNSFGEYFAALYISEKSSEIFQYNEFLYNEEYNNIRFFFDLVVSQNSKAHIAVLYNNFELLIECNEEELVRRDKIERTAFDLALNRRRKYPILKTSKTNHGCYIYYSNVKLEGFKDVAFQKILNFLCDYNGNHQNSIFSADNFFLLPLIRLSQEDKTKISEFRNKLLPTLLFYAVLEDSTVFEQLKYIPLVKTDYRETLLHLAVTCKSVNSLKRILYNENYKNFLTEHTKLLSTMCNSTFGKILKIHQIDLNVVDSDKKTPFHHACESNNLEAINFLIQSGAKLNTRSKNGETPLHCALDCCSLEVTQLLIQNGADVNIRDASSKTVLHYACQNRRRDLLQLLIENNADLNVADGSGQAAIHYVCLKGSSDTLNLLIRNGANVNLTDKTDKTPLHYVCANQQVSDEVVTILIKAGAQLNALDTRGDAPIHYACQKGFSEKVKLLVKSGAKVNLGDRKRRTALHYCCYNKKISDDVVKLLIRKSARKDVTDKTDRAAVHYACMSGSLNKLKLLIEGGASVNATNSYGQTVLHYVCQHQSISPSFINILIDNKADLNVADDCCRTPLHYACLNGLCEKVILLIQNGVRLNIKDDVGRTPLHYTCENPNISLDCVETLIKNEAKLNIIDKADCTAIQYACASASLEKLKLLIQNGADVNIKNSASRTALHFVCERSSIPHSVLQVLIDSEAKLNIFDNHNCCPIHYACYNGSSEKLILLIKRGARVTTKDSDDKTALHYACQNDFFSIKVVRALLERGAHVNAVDRDGRTPMHYACINNNSLKIDTLLGKRANQNIKDRNGKKPFQYASQDVCNSLKKRRSCLLSCIIN